MPKPSTISRREFVGGAVLSGAIGSSVHASNKTAKKPNIVFILADDLGWGDLSCYGRPDYSTPNLDALARQGIRFTNAYSASPLCTPTRCGLMTGRYPARTPVGLQEPLRARKDLGQGVETLGLAPDHPTLSSLIKKNGYETALVGKWHLGYLPRFGPNHHGFDKFFGILSGGAGFFTHKDTAGENDLFEDETPVERIGYMTDLLTNRAVEFISARHERPFYLSLHYTAPHWPWEGPGDAKTASAIGLGYAGFTAGGSLKTYAAMVRRLDDGVGHVLRALKRSGLERNTLVIFTSDNGGERFSYNWPFTGQKFQLYEGGIRVPAIVRWPGVIAAGRSTNQVAITMDWTATMLAVAGANPDPAYPLDGIDMLPLMNGKRSDTDRTLFWRHGSGTDAAVRSGNWKYLNFNGQEYLFDLAVDEREQSDFKRSKPELFQKLKGAFAEWQRTVLPRPEPRPS